MVGSLGLRLCERTQRLVLQTTAFQRINALANEHQFMRATVNFHRSRWYCHCSLSTWIPDADQKPREYVLDFSRRGFRLQQGIPADAYERIPVKLTNPKALLQWRSPKRQSRISTKVQILLAVLFPRRFNNCASTIARCLSLTARTPNDLFIQLMREQTSLVGDFLQTRTISQCLKEGVSD